MEKIRPWGCRDFTTCTQFAIGVQGEKESWETEQQKAGNLNKHNSRLDVSDSYIGNPARLKAVFS